MSEQPIIGLWRIMTLISGRYNVTSLQEFQVSKFVLPKFGVYVDTISDLVIDDRSLTVGVYGKYTYGKFVEGTAKVDLLRPYSNATILTKTTPVKDHRAVVTFELDNKLRLNTHTWINVLATVEEGHTGIKQTIMQQVNIRLERYKIIVPDDEIKFRDNKPYQMKAIVEHWNGTRVYDRKTPLTMTHGEKSYEALQDEQGVATFTFDPVADDSYTIKYRESSTIVPVIQSSDDPGPNATLESCTLTLKGGRYSYTT